MLAGTDQIFADFRRLAHQIFEAEDWELHPVSGGANNRVFCVESKGQKLLLKCYFHDPLDPRDRYQAEKAFYEFAWGQGIRRTPQPLAWAEPEKRMGVFNFVEGRKLAAEEVSLNHVEQALAFVRELNQGRSQAGQLGPGSEACFTLQDHLECVDRRIARLDQIETKTDADAQAEHFVQSELSPGWKQVLEWSRSEARQAGLNPSQPIAQAERCVSPSDFGFHNALLGTDGQLRFFDFEYAGWDDPAKLVCDFFCQPQIPVLLDYLDAFVAALDQVEPQQSLRPRVRLLLPVYQVKWSCIMLNEFLKGGRARRSFSVQETDWEERKARQLEKSARLLRLCLAMLEGT